MEATFQAAIEQMTGNDHFDIPTTEEFFLKFIYKYQIDRIKIKYRDRLKISLYYTIFFDIITILIINLTNLMKKHYNSIYII